MSIIITTADVTTANAGMTAPGPGTAAGREETSMTNRSPATIKDAMCMTPLADAEHLSRQHQQQARHQHHVNQGLPAFTATSPRTHLWH
jgi:hypothetical protein